MIRSVHKIVVPVSDQEAARQFWTGMMGFKVVIDEAYGEGRWVEVTPPDGGVRLILSPRRPDEPRRTVSDQLPHSDVFFACRDIQRTHAELVTRGVRFHTAPVQMPFGWWSMFEDQEGTRYVLTQP